MENQCLNCDAKTSHKYCDNCGQKVDLKYRYKSLFFLISSGISQILLLDNKFFRTFGTLLFKPGVLTNEYMKGRLHSYLTPITVFLLALLFSLLLNVNPLANSVDANVSNNAYFGEMVNKKMAETGWSKDYLEGVYDERANGWGKITYLILIVLLSLISALIFYFKRKKYVFHLVFWVHTFCAIALIIMPLTFKFITLPDLHFGPSSTVSGEAVPYFIFSLVYLSFALKNAMCFNLVSSFFISIPLIIFYILGTVMAQSINFYFTMLTL